jgi:hypothetical protein
MPHLPIIWASIALHAKNTPDIPVTFATFEVVPSVSLRQHHPYLYQPSDASSGFQWRWRPSPFAMDIFSCEQRQHGLKNSGSGFCFSNHIHRRRGRPSRSGNVRGQGIDAIEGKYRERPGTHISTVVDDLATWVSAQCREYGRHSAPSGVSIEDVRMKGAVTGIQRHPATRNLIQHHTIHRVLPSCKPRPELARAERAAPAAHPPTDHGPRPDWCITSSTLIRGLAPDKHCQITRARFRSIGRPIRVIHHQDAPAPPRVCFN